MHPKMIESPDIILKKEKIAIFLNGCFWHRCPADYIPPKTRMGYWATKMEANVERDRKNRLALKRKGWKVITIWEHQIKNDWIKTASKLLSYSK